MSDPASALDADAVALLLTLMEAPEACLSGAALHDFHAQAGQALIAARALRADGHEPIATCMADHDDVPVTLEWRDEAGGYAYFSPLAGWVTVENERLARYRVDFRWVLMNLARQLRVPRTIEALCLVPDHLWEIGPAWLGHRRTMTKVFFGRRFRQPDVLDATCLALQRRANGRMALLLVSGDGPHSHLRIPGQPVVAALGSCLAAGAGLSLDPGILASRFGGSPPARGQEPLEIFGDGRTVWFYGEKFAFPRGDKQRRVIAHLHQQYLGGTYEVPAAEIIAELDLAEDTRIDKLFKGSPAWNRLVTQRSGMVRFCWPDEDNGGREKAVAGA